MSGIAVEVAHAGYEGSLDTVSRMLARLRHRGPDGARVVTIGGKGVTGAIGYAATIITPEDVGTVQPLVLGSGTVIAFHGRLDNRPALLSELEIRDPVPDARIAGEAYDRWGAKAPSRMLGDFAFVAYSPHTGETFAARDHLGMRPLFYWRAPDGRLRLASEKQALFADGAFEPKVNRAMLALAVIEQYIERDETIIEGIWSIPPGSCLSLRGDELEIRVYWQIDVWKPSPVSRMEDAKALFASTLDLAVEARLRAIGPVAVTVSGGLDSSTVAAVASSVARRTAMPAPVLVTTRYGRGASDELPFAQRVADHLGLPLNVFNAPEAPASYPPSYDVDRYFEPYAQLLAGMEGLFRARGARVVLSGIGGDDLQPAWTNLEVDQALHDRDFGSAVRWSVYSEPFAWQSWRRLLGAFKRFVLPPDRPLPLSVTNRIPAYVGLEARKLIDERWRALGRQIGHYRGTGPVREVNLGWLTHSINTRTTAQDEQLTAATGIVGRHPLLDVRIVDLLVSFPLRFIFDREMPKPLLRHVAASLLPSSIAYRTRKCVFVHFFHALVCRERELYRPLLAESLLEEAGLIERGALVRLLDEAVDAPARAYEVLTVVGLEGWLRGLLRNKSEPVFTVNAGLNHKPGVRILW